jgi:phosphoribosylformimino-5-aminoimidazole carboxamide ribotide isomerase
MIIYPAIDLKDGKCVRLHRGDMDTQVIYNDNPAAQARDWATAGFSWIHVVDLNGAVDGKPVNESAVQSILSAVDLPVQLGGGIRTVEQVDAWLMAGVSRVILGTAAVKDPTLVWTVCDLFPGQIAVGIDARQGRVAIDGWTKDSGILAVDLARQFEDAGVCAIIYTDIDRDGTGAGLNMDETIKLAQSVSIPVIASGGVGSMEDIKKVRAAGANNVQGVIVGKALYDGRINPRDALSLC